jgi:type VI secretion system secreted protein Hcp
MSIFVKFDGVDGECRIKGFERFSEVESFEIGVEKSLEGATGQSRRRGDVKLGDVTITKILDSAAPSMFLVTAISHVFPLVRVLFTESFTKDVTDKQPARNVYMEVLLEDAIVSNYSISGSGDDPPTETVVLSYTRITYRYKLVNKSGAMDNTVVERAAAGAQITGGVLVGSWDAEVCKQYACPFPTSLR